MQHPIRLISTLACALLSFIPAAYAQDDAPNSFRINNIRSNGSGCPVGTVAVNISSDQQAFTLSFSEFTAEVSPTLGRALDRKTCMVVFDSEQDVGWEYAVLAVTYRGFAALESGVVGSQRLRFGLTGKKSDATMNLTGPFEADYVNTQEFGLGNMKWSGCQGNANKQKDFAIDATITLQASNNQSQGLFTVDTADGEIRQEYEVLWRKCQGPSQAGKKSLAICRLNANGPGNSGIKSLLTKGQGKNENQALSKAKSQMTKKCSKSGCNANMAVCSVTGF